MSTVVAIGSDSAMEGFGLTGVRVIVADDASTITGAWDSLDHTVGLVILCPDAAEVLASRLASPGDRLTVVMP